LADIFEEVEEGLRQDRMRQLWQKYGFLAYLSAALLLGSVGLYEYLKHRNTERIETQARAYELASNALENRDYEDAAAQFSALLEQDVEVSAAAGHLLARTRLEGNGDIEAASQTLLDTTRISKGSEIQAIDALALIKSAYLQSDLLDREALENLLLPLTGKDTGFSALANELLAAKALADGDIETARRGFTALRFAENVPPGVIVRANQALAGLPAAPLVSETPADAEDEDLSDQTESVITQDATEPQPEIQE